MSAETVEEMVERLSLAKARQAQSRSIAIAEQEKRLLDAVAGQQSAIQIENPNPFAGITEAMAAMLAKITPIEPTAYRARIFRDDIAPRLEAFGFSDRYRINLTDWNCPEQERVFRKVQKLAVGIGAIIALVGLRGTGKTTIAAQMAVGRAWQDWESAVSGERITHRATPYRKLNDLVSRFKPLYTDQGSIDTERLISSRAYFCGEHDLAIIDELHECDDIKAGGRLLTDFLDRRYSRHLDTLLISNQTDAAFRASVSQSVLSRISEHGIIIECKWPSFRETRSHLTNPTKQRKEEF